MIKKAHLVNLIKMLFYFYRYNKKNIIKNYYKALRLQYFVTLWSRWFFFLKFNRRLNNSVPELQKWSYRSLYIHKRHFRQKTNSKKMILLHLFWILDVLKLVHPFNLKGLATTYPIRFFVNIIDNLEIYVAFQKWIYLWGLNKDKIYPYSVTPLWKDQKPQLWMTRTYSRYAIWYLKNKLHYKLRKKKSQLWFLNLWYLYNSSFHYLQNRLQCQVKPILPLHYTRTLWLRLMQYPVVYNFNWFPSLRHLSLFSHRTLLPWELTFSSQQTWMFDFKATGLIFLLKALVKLRIYITDYILIKRWKDLLKGNDLMSRSFQIFIRSNSFFKRIKLD